MQTIENIDFATRQAVTGILEMAKSELANLHEGETFLLSDLFYGYIWKRIPDKDRKLVGRYFLDFADSEEGKKAIEALNKTSQNQQIYVHK
ncbi:MAG: single-stranded DNA-binding protein [Oscillospiraceae bacterium]|jgi:hypothetical protein|nr:single-stranded DNA-binding protein [Oscillospiraceae bacterium]